jgi:hypothetical protein
VCTGTTATYYYAPTHITCVCTSQVLHTVVRHVHVCITHYKIVVYTLHFVFVGENTPQQTLQPIAVFPLVLFKNSFVAYSLYIWYSAKEYDG